MPVRVKLLTSLVGPAGVYKAGDTADLHDEDALRYIKAGLAEPLGDASPARDGVVAYETGTTKTVQERAVIAPTPRRARKP